ncbi:MAG: RNA polymerase sigma factor, partial [Ktedonobacteraceae bacterium]
MLRRYSQEIGYNGQRMENEAQDRQEVEWIERAQNGEQEAFGLLVERYHQKVFSTVFHIIRQPDQAEDLAQEVFLKVFRAIRSYNFRAPFRAWLARITINHCYDFLRRQKSSKISYYWQFTEEGRRMLDSRPEPQARGRLNIEEETSLKDLVR